MTIKDIRNLALKKKEELIKNNENLDKINIAINILKDDMCFFKVDINIMVPILLYLGISENQVKNVYFELINYNNYQANNIVRNAIDK